jgi:hypothetical protein
MKNVNTEVSPTTRASDLRAALATYGVEIALPDKIQPATHRVMLSVPLAYIQNWKQLFAEEPVEALEGPPDARTSPNLYDWLTVKLVQRPPSPMDFRQRPAKSRAPEPDYSRWPFYVESEMIITINLDGRKWVATFHPFRDPRAKKPKRLLYQERDCIFLPRPDAMTS